MEPAKNQNTWKISLLVSLGVIVVLGAVLFFLSRPRWHVADSGTLEIPAGHVYVDDFHAASPQRVRVTLTERRSVPVVAYWVDQRDHAWIQSDRPPDDGLLQRLDRQTFVRTMKGFSTGEARVDTGQYYLYFEQDPFDDEAKPLQLDYAIEVRR